jgi:hypothetical protein
MYEISRSCSTYGGEERRRDHLEDPGRRKWVDNIQMHLQEVDCRGMDWIELA